MRTELKTMIILMGITLVVLASFSSATQERRPVDGPPLPKDGNTPPACPTDFKDVACSASGVKSSTTYAWALSAAGIECVGEMKNCIKEQLDEVSLNKLKCERVAGCKLKYMPLSDDCEMGDASNCTPLPGTENDPSNQTYTCRIRGFYDAQDYRCDRDATLQNGEIAA